MPLSNAKNLTLALSAFCIVASSAVFAGDDMVLRGAYAAKDEKAQSDKSKIKASWGLRFTEPDPITTGSLVSQAQERDDTTSQLRGFVNQSILSSDALRATMHDSYAAQEARSEAWFNLLPEVNFTADVGVTNSPIISGGPNQTRSTNQGTVAANWRLFNSGAGIASIRSADFAALASSARYLAEERRILMESLGIYLQIYASQQLVDSLSKTRKRLSRIRYATKKRYQAGFASRTDIAQVDGEIAALDSQIQSAKGQVAQQKIAWKTRTNKDLAGRLSKPDIRTLLGGKKDAILARAMRGNSSIASARYAALSAKEKSKSDMASFLPSVSAYASATNDLSSFSNSNYEWKAGVQLTVPLVNMAGTSKYRQSKEAARAAKYRAADTRKKVSQDIETNWESLAGYRVNSKILKRKKSAAKRVVTGVSKEVKAGLRPVEDLLREEIKLARSSMEILQNDVNMIAATYRIAIHFSDLKLADFISR